MGVILSLLNELQQYYGVNSKSFISQMKMAAPKMTSNGRLFNWSLLST